MSIRKNRARCYVLGACFSLLAAADAQQEQTDPRVVREKIQWLGTPDDTIPYDQDPRRWLEQRREQIIPHLIEGLANPKHEVAEGCLSILGGCSASEEIKEAFLRVAGDKSHLLNQRVVFGLCRFANDPRARRFLEAGLSDTAAYPKPEERARFAEALGEKEKAVALLVPLLQQDSDYEVVLIIRRIEQIGDRSAIPMLERATADSRWKIASAAYLALATIDPKGHHLSADAVEFLNNTVRVHKATREFYDERRKKLAALSRSDIRPFVMQMLGSDADMEALGILRIWRDKDALPEIRKRISTAGRRRDIQYIAAYLEIDGTDASLEEVIGLFKQDAGRDEQGEMLRGIVASKLPNDRKLAVLRGVREKIGGRLPEVVPRSLRSASTNGSPLLIPLMREETNLWALGAYAASLPNGGGSESGTLVRRALEMLVSSKEHLGSEAATEILDACARCELAGSGSLSDKFLGSATPRVRIAAARVSAKLGGKRGESPAILYRDLGDADKFVRNQASACVLDIPCQGERERSPRERVVLSLLGKESEDYALRVLTTCGGVEATKALDEILDGEDAQRSIHAAWVQAQLADKQAANRAIRRIAIYAMFHHQVYQQGSGIDFGIAPEIRFHRTTSRLNAGNVPREDASPVKIPAALFQAFHLDKEEQTFCVRAYRSAIRSEPLRSLLRHEYGSDSSVRTMDESHLPLLRVIASQEPYIEALHVKGKKIAYFPGRKAAAQIIARLTGKPASYLGLKGEELDSAALPSEPYPEQDLLIAKAAFDLIEAAGLSRKPHTDVEWQRVERYDTMVRRLVDDEFGNEVQNVLITEASQRHLAAFLKDAGFYFWRELAVE